MRYRKSNSYTWILHDGKKSIEEQVDLLDQQSISKSFHFHKEKKRRNPTDQLKNYKKFIKVVFAERTFISQKEFNILLQKSFNSSPTWYRRRMIELGLITEKHKLIKPIL